MSVEVEFSWVLDNGAKIHVEADGTYIDGEVHFVALGFTTDRLTEGRGIETLEWVKREWGQIEEHAAILICEKAREEVLEAV